MPPIIQSSNSTKKTNTLAARRLTARNRNNHTLPLVLLHGWGSNSQTWNPLIESFLIDHDIVLIDLPGFGANRNLEGLSLNELLAQIYPLLPGQCCLIGWSLGGMLATRLAFEFHFKIQCLITLATNPCFVATETWPQAMQRQTFETFYGDFKQNPSATIKRFNTLQALGDGAKKVVLEQLVNDQDEFFNEMQPAWLCALDLLQQLDNSQLIGSIQCEALHLFGQNDALVPVAAAQALSDLVPEQQVKIFESRGHAPHLSAAAEVGRTIRKFLERQEELNKFKRSKSGVANAFSKAALSYDDKAELQKKAAKILVNKCGVMKGKVLDLACGTGFTSEHLIANSAVSKLVLVDISEPMLNLAMRKLTGNNPHNIALEFLMGDMDDPPVNHSDYDFVLSNMSVQWSENLPRLLQHVYSALAPGGVFAFSAPGPETLKELKKAWRQVDAHVHVNNFYSAADIAQFAEDVGFLCELKESQFEKRRYNSVTQLMQSIKATGAHNVNQGRNHGLTGKTRLQKLQNVYRLENSEVTATWEILYFVLRKGR